jgi:hypothetical protein
MDEVANVEVLSQGEAVFSGEGQHVLHGAGYGAWEISVRPATPR